LHTANTRCELKALIGDDIVQHTTDSENENAGEDDPASLIEEREISKICDIWY